MRDLDSIPTDARDLTPAEAAAFARVRPATIRQWVRRGILTPTFRTLGGQARFALLDVARAEARLRQEQRSGLSNGRMSA